MKDLPKVSVIIPTYNRWPLICSAIDSVLAQTYPNTECIVVDDCSSDQSYEKVKEKYGSSIVLLRNDINLEKSASRNKGVLSSDAEYVCFLDSDDVLTENAVQARVDVFKQKSLNSGLVYGITLSDQESKESITADSFSVVNSVDDYLANKGGLRTNSFLMGRQELIDLGLYNEALTNQEDIELFIRLLCSLDIYSCGEVISVVRNVCSSRARDNWDKIISQGTCFSESLFKNEQVKKKLGAKLSIIALNEQRELLRALYRSRQYAQYRKQYMHGVKRKVPFPGIKYFLRYFISLIKK